MENKTHKNIDKETIALSHLKDKKNFKRIKYDEQSEEKKKKFIENMEKEKKNSIKSYYRIDDKSMHILETVFNNLKFKVKLSNFFYLENERICEKKDMDLVIYDISKFEILSKIKYENIDRVESVIELENHDLLLCFSTLDMEYSHINFRDIILIYRLNNFNYSLLQTIKESEEGFNIPEETLNNRYLSGNAFEWAKKLNGGKFLCSSYYGIRIYSLNEYGLYENILIFEYDKYLKKIYEINEKELLLISEDYLYSSSINYNHLYIDKLEIKEEEEKEEKEEDEKDEINENKINEDLEKEIKDKKTEINVDNNNNNFFSKIKGIFNFLNCFSRYHRENNQYNVFISQENKSKENNLFSLKIKCSMKNILDYCTYKKNDFCNFSDYVVLQNKYFVIMIDSKILIYNLLNGLLVKKYLILDCTEKLMLACKGNNIIKWNCENDNEFLLVEKGDITLFELIEISKEEEKISVDLKIKGYIYNPDIQNLVKINNENKFYIEKDEFIYIY